ncbi:hypothetical protein J1792_03370 [Streptomyces triculaminicus]|uniref:Uncharacterized protein n=2 Tax=Streptomyces TaxID=1883 RepID=A0A939JNP4_9ACTN|nr:MULTISPECIES: hypothetical protein [Streptomyces]MBO0651867.1 hypothetical protein [Streptomyces triculaminicus]QSY47209.1 hypothetical protein J3S04_17705 [Streptomyces griseocarneus]
MYVSIVMWDLKKSEATVESLRDYLRDYAVDAYSTLDGMRLKAWFSNAERQVWGAVYLWDRPDQMQSLFSVSKAIEIIGYPPTSVGAFALEAIAEGNSVHETLTGLGLALESGLEAGPETGPAAGV